MHAEDHKHGAGGELHHDTAAIIGHTLDMQEKVVKDAMTPIDQVSLPLADTIEAHTIQGLHALYQFSARLCYFDKDTQSTCGSTATDVRSHIAII
jgi:CBS domain containing-hemolysin-like protein